MLVKLNEFDVVDGIVHPDATQHTARGAGVFHDEMLQAFHNFKRSGRDDLFGFRGTKQVGHEVKFSKVVGHKWVRGYDKAIFFSMSANITLNCLSVSNWLVMVLQA